jgi:NAD+ diphosphatase
MSDMPSFVSRTSPRRAVKGPVWWFAFRDNRLLVQSSADGLETLPPFAMTLDSLGLEPTGVLYLGELGDAHCFAAGLEADTDPPPGYDYAGLRQLFDRLPQDLFAVAVRAIQLIAWDRDNRFCGRCGAPTENQTSERAKRCPACGLSRYPRISPAIIVAVTRGPQLLLARAQRHPAGFFSVLAGFVEPGETLEEAVRREVKEEVGLDIEQIAYFGSQPWPFPDSLMLAFQARYAGGVITREEAEIAEAGWYAASEIPERIPPPISIARRLIDDFVARHGHPG